MTHLLIKIAFPVLLALMSQFTSAKIYYVTPDTNGTCPGSEVDILPCFTLSQYATKPNNYFVSRTTFILLPGYHTLDSRLLISGIEFLSIVGNTTSSLVYCNGFASFTFQNINVVSMRGFVLVGCASNFVSSVVNFTIENSSLRGHNGTGLYLKSVNMANIVRSSFSSNTGELMWYPTSQRIVEGGGAILIENSTLTIFSSTLTNNSVIGHHVNGGGIIAISSTVIIDSSTFTNNTVAAVRGYGGAVCALESNITISNTKFSNNGVQARNDVVGGTIFYNSMTAYGGAVYVHSSLIIIHNSTFTNNTVNGDGSSGGALYTESTNVTINSSTFINSTAIGIGASGGAMYTESTNITIHSNTFTGNRVSEDIGDQALVGGAVHYAYACYIIISDSTFSNNTLSGSKGAGGVVSAMSSTISTSNSTFIHNQVIAMDEGLGGAIWIQSCTIRMNSSKFTGNSVTGNWKTSKLNYSTFTAGGSLYAILSNVSINRSKFSNSYVTGDNGYGGGLIVSMGRITIQGSTFTNNTATKLGGATSIINSTTSINCSKFESNIVTGYYLGAGGAMYATLSSFTLEINDTIFTKNAATGYQYGYGGAVYADAHNITINRSTFTNNVAMDGGAIYLMNTYLNTNGFLDIQKNIGNRSTLAVIHSKMYLKGNTRISNNYGSLYAFSSNITFADHTNIINNSYNIHTNDTLGGAITLVHSNIVFTDMANISYNTGLYGGGISLATQSKFYVYGDITISHNKALLSGGGIYAYQSELNFEKTVYVGRNSAVFRGGGIHCISSIVRIIDRSQTRIVGNDAKRGGGICLEFNSKIYLTKNHLEHINSLGHTRLWLRLEFTGNSADYGGALYITDDTNSGTCYATPFKSASTLISTQCFIQGLSLDRFEDSFINICNTYFTNNSARRDGELIYGGLLDRCTANIIAEFFLKYPNLSPSSLSAVSYILNITNINTLDFSSAKLISSDPVRVCFCRDNQPDCSYHPEPRYVRKGERFSVSLVAVDQANNTIKNSIIHASVTQHAKLGEGQSAQQTNVNETCADLEYTILSPHNYEYLFLYADGPCMDIGISKANLTVYIEPCPVGFTDNNLRCECEAILYNEYIHNCSIDNQTVLRKGNVWFSYVNTTEQPQSYVLHKHCPFDYCRPPTESVEVELSDANGADAICAFNRTGKLCGSCKVGLSLSLGSSRCMPCSNNWIALLFVFAIAGIALIVFLLACNVTVAMGTINGLIFYANIIAANTSIFLPFDRPNVLTVFIAWLNLDFGIETCFYDGMDAYAKTWLQLAFPIYVISLVVAIIVISDYSFKFAVLFTKGKDPIATLATLILLSYTKLLRTIIASLSFTTMEYSDGSHELVWLTDANVLYLKGKHIPLFITAIAIVLIGTTFTLVLFGWQWLVRCPNVRPFTWITKNTKFISFMDVYHNPYDKNHRYWIGLLLLVRCLLYIVPAVNILGDPRINLLSIIIAVVILKSFQVAVLQNHKIHKTTMLHTLENVSFLNLIGFASATFYIAYSQKSQVTVAYISIGITFTTFLAILTYHACVFMLRKPFQKCKNLCTTHKVKTQPSSQLIDTDFHNNDFDKDEKQETVSVTEIDALPKQVDSLTDEDQSEGTVPAQNNTALTKHKDTIEPNGIQGNTARNSSEVSRQEDSASYKESVRNEFSIMTIRCENEENEDDNFWGDETTPLLINDDYV